MCCVPLPRVSLSLCATSTVCHSHVYYSYCVPTPTVPLSFLCSLLFYSSGPSVDFMKLNKLSAMGNTKCSPHTDTVVSMTLDIASERVYWVTVRYSRLLLNWADYKNENCSYRLADTIRCVHTSIRDICMYIQCL